MCLLSRTAALRVRSVRCRLSTSTGCVHQDRHRGLMASLPAFLEYFWTWFVCFFWNVSEPELLCQQAALSLPWDQNRRTVALLCVDYKVDSRPYWHELVQCLLNIPQMRLQVVGQGWRNGGGPSRESSEPIPVLAEKWTTNLQWTTGRCVVILISCKGILKTKPLLFSP